MAKKRQPAKRRSGGKAKRFDRILTIGTVIALLVIALALWGPLRNFRVSHEQGQVQQTRKPERRAKKETGETGQKQKKQEHASGKDRKEPVQAARGTSAVRGSEEKPARVAIVIDDLGQDLNLAKQILEFPYRITVAVMPGLPNSRKVAELARQSNHEVLLHLPMEYRSRNGKPAPGMLRSDMTPMAFLAVLSDDVASVPGAVGVNNHEGSSLTENKEAMKFLMAELKARNLLFLDSLTSAQSVAYATAREFGLKASRRDVFLDNDSNNGESIRRQFDELARTARERGHAIGIGHPHPGTIAEMRKWLATAAGQGIQIVPVSSLSH